MSQSVYKTGVCETGLSECYKMVFALFRSTFIRLSPKIIKYRNCNGFNENIFCHELNETLLKGEMYKSEALIPNLLKPFKKFYINMPL